MHYKSCSPTERGKNNNSITCAFREADGLTRRVRYPDRLTVSHRRFMMFVLLSASLLRRYIIILVRCNAHVCCTNYNITYDEPAI